MQLIDLKLLWRDWRGGQLNLIVSALVLAVMVVTAVSLLADRVEGGLNQQVGSFLASDLVVQAGIEIGPEYVDQAKSLDLQTANMAQFRSMVFAGDNNHLASVKAVSQAYPLVGQMELVTNLNESSIEKKSSGPAKGEVWVDPRLLELLDVEVGDQIEVGYSALTITQLIVHEPDRGTGFSMSGARVMMAYSDLQDAQLIRPGSQIRFRLLMAGESNSINDYTEWFEQRKEQTIEQEGQHFRLLTPDNSEQSLAQAIQRGRSFLLLAGTIGVLLAGLAMALAANRYAERLTDQVALMKAWGQTSRRIRRSQIVRLMILTLVATIIGMALGWLVHFFLLEVAKELFSAELPAAGWRPWWVALLTGFACMLGFALPALWHLPMIEPLRVLRRDLPDDFISSSRRIMIGVATLLALTYWYSQDIVVSFIVFRCSASSIFSVRADSVADIAHCTEFRQLARQLYSIRFS